jgi:NADH:ubiquinone oxidoreductase subunit 3 (subunit A)
MIQNNDDLLKQNNSISIDLETLQKQYSNLLIKYRQAVMDYMNHLNETTKGVNSNLVSTKGQAYYGTGSAGQSNAKTLQECEASCSKTPGCTGATFVSNGNNNTCALRTGDSQIFVSSNNSYSIVPRTKQILMNIDSINQQLITTNQQILNKISSSEPLYDKQYLNIKERSKELVNNYNDLLQERRKIMDILNDYETLDNKQEENEIKITQNYYSFLLFFLLFLVILYLLFKIFISGISSQNIQYGGELGNKTYNIIFIIIIITIIIIKSNYLTKKYYH